MTRRLLVCVGEGSGDALAAAVLDRLRATGEATDARGIVGPALRARGVVPMARAEEVGAVGLVEALGAASRAPGALRRVLRAVDGWRPDVALTVDNPGFNLALARRLRARGIRVVHLVAPQVWAWRPGRARRVAASVDVLLCLLPFEPRWFPGCDARFVGHPAAWPLGTRGEEPIVVLAPGSRASEVAALVPAFAAAAAALARRMPAVRFRVAVAPTVDPAALAALPGERSFGLRSALDGARAALLASGTATIEAAAAGVPFVAAYRAHPLTWAVGRRLARVRHLALPNVLVGGPLVPEHLQALEPETLAADLAHLLGAEGDAIGASLRAVAAALEGEGAVARIAATVA